MESDASQASSSFHCPVCSSCITVPEAKFCPFCGYSLKHASESDSGASTVQGTGINLVKGHQPEAEAIQFSLGPYQILRSIGKGGMGEVFLAYDTICGRKLALKKIRSDLYAHSQMQNRFLKEAHITSQLTHPSIIPIYTINREKDDIFYTMPFVEGETLKQMLRSARILEKKGAKDQTRYSIPSLVRIFINVCQAIAYSHAKGVLHRDVKPENIIVGQYGEVQILDWGLAKMIHATDEEEGKSEFENIRPLHGLTRFGRVVGTVSYMAPERALGMPATYQTDVYALGVILYQILTLRLPFQRKSLAMLRKNLHKETFIDPAKIAPYRDVPRSLARIVSKCLQPSADQRYQTVQALIHELENYIEGRSEWFQIAELDIRHKKDWEFQENVLIAEHMAITRETESDWVSLMISKSSFSENIKIEAAVRIGDKGSGLGFLLSIPEAAERRHLNDGYCLWLGSDLFPSTKLLRSTVEVMHATEIALQRHEWYRIRIEKIDHNIHFYLNDVLQMTYISHQPLMGTHVGLLARDADFEIRDFFVFIGGQNVTVNCLAVPDAFLAHKDYNTALSEYRRIGYSFPGRAEGREAMFRAGITLLEQARNTSERATEYFDIALEEFSKLHSTPGAPLEYLGKALVYQAMSDYEEEIKCYELAYRRYPNHPLLPILQEHIVYRMHECSRLHRKAAYSFILLVVRHLPSVAAGSNAKKLFASLQKHWEALPFIEEEPGDVENEWLKNCSFSIVLAFWLAKPYVLAELIDDLLKFEPLSITALSNALFSLLELGSWQIALKKLEQIRSESDAITYELQLLEIAIRTAEKPLWQSLEEFFKVINAKTFAFKEERVLLYLLKQALLSKQPHLVHEAYEQLKAFTFSPAVGLDIDSYRIWAYLLQAEWENAGELLHKYPLEVLMQDTHPLHFLYGCWLYATEGSEIAGVHFSGILEVSYPRTNSLFSHFLLGKLGNLWLDKAFLWEKRMLYCQLSLLYDCVADEAQAHHFLQLEEEQYVVAEP